MHDTYPNHNESQLRAKSSGDSQLLVLTLVGCLCLVQSASGQKSVKDDNTLILPVEVLRNNPTLAVGDGVDHSALGSVFAEKESAFAVSHDCWSRNASSPSSNAATEVQHDGVFDPASEFKFSEVESLRELTESSSFGIKAKVSSPYFSASAEMNSTAHSELSKSRKLIFGSTRYETDRCFMTSIPTDASDLAPEVQDLLEELSAAQRDGDVIGGAEVRSRFYNKYGSGFILEMTRGGMFWVQQEVSREFSLTSMTQKQKAKGEGGASGVSASVEASTSSSTETKKEDLFTDIEGNFYGGKPDIPTMTWKGFQEAGTTWYESLRANEQYRRTLSATFIPYEEIVVLRPLTTRPKAWEEDVVDFLGFFGSAERPQAGGFLRYLDGYDVQFGSFPVLQPIRGGLSGSTFKLLTAVDPGVLDEDVDFRRRTWSEGIGSSHVSEYQPEGDDLVDAPRIIGAMVLPVLQVLDENGRLFKEIGSGDPLRIWPAASGPISVQAFLNEENKNARPRDRRTWVNFRLGDLKDLFPKALRGGRVQLLTMVTVDGMRIAFSNPLPISVDDAGGADDRANLTFKVTGPLSAAKDPDFHNDYSDLLTRRFGEAASEVLLYLDGCHNSKLVLTREQAYKPTCKFSFPSKDPGGDAKRRNRECRFTLRDQLREDPSFGCTFNQLRKEHASSSSSSVCRVTCDHKKIGSVLVEP